jgi:quinolinate synthase
MSLWNGACHVHSRFSVSELIKLKKQYPEAEVVAHPECKKAVLELSDYIGSTQAILNYVRKSDKSVFIVLTESGILHKMQLACPDKTFIPVPPEASELMVDGKLVPCSCNECEYMRMNTLEKLYNCLLNETNEVLVDEQTAQQAIRSINRMLEMSN